MPASNQTMQYGMFIILFIIFGLGLQTFVSIFLRNMLNNPVKWEEQKKNIIMCIYIMILSICMIGGYLWYYSSSNIGIATNLLFVTCCFAFGVACWSLMASMISKT